MAVKPLSVHGRFADRSLRAHGPTSSCTGVTEFISTNLNYHDHVNLRIGEWRLRRVRSFLLSVNGPDVYYNSLVQLGV